MDLFVRVARKRSRVVLRQPTLSLLHAVIIPWPTTTFVPEGPSSSRAVSQTEASSRSMSLFLVPVVDDVLDLQEEEIKVETKT